MAFTNLHLASLTVCEPSGQTTYQCCQNGHPNPPSRWLHHPDSLSNPPDLHQPCSSDTGEFCKPKVIIINENNPVGLTNAAISHALSDKGTWQYPFSRSNLLTYLADPTLSMQSSIRRSRKEFGFVILFTLRKSEQNLGVLLEFDVSRQSDTQLKEDGSAKPLSGIYCLGLPQHEGTQTLTSKLGGHRIPMFTDQLSGNSIVSTR